MSKPFHQIDDTLRAALPVGTCFFFLLLTFVPWPSDLFRHIMASFVLMALCYWVIHKPDLFAMRWSFIIGFLYDVLMGQPLGVSALTYLVADFFLRSQRSFFAHQPFVMLWLAFGMIVAVANAVQWVVASILAHHMLELFPILFQALIAVLLFPLLTMLLHHLQRLFLSRL